MKIRTATSTLHAMVFAAIAGLLTVAGQASTETPTPAFEPALRDLWTRGSERFHRQWLIAGPIDASANATVDVASINPAVGQSLTEQAPNARWSAHTSWTDVTDFTSVGGRAVTTGAAVDRYVYVVASLQRGVASSEELSIGSERPYSVWLNAQQVHSRTTLEGFAPDRDRIPVELRQGENLIVVRLHETSIGPSQFSLRSVPRGTALTKSEEIAPVIVSSTDRELLVRTHYANDKNAAPVQTEVFGAGGKVIASRTASRGEVVRFDASGWKDGAYELRVVTQDGWNRSSVRYLPWYKGDAIAAVRKLIASADNAKPDVHGSTVKMLAELAIDRLGGSLDTASPAAWRLVHAPLLEFEELELDAAGHQGSVHGGGFVRLAYIDDVDGSTQFCRAYLPTQYTSTKRWPLVTSLHGINPPNPVYVDWWRVDDRHNPIAMQKEVIFMEPHGRGNAQYLGIGERDVLRCIAEAKRRFAVDEDRVYLTGESMGGHGTWAIASRHPDLFAAAAPVLGGWDFRITNVSAPVTRPPPETQMDAYSLERASSFAAAENLLHVPLFVLHGDADAVVHVENSRYAVRLMQRWGYNVRYHEMPGLVHEDLGHTSAIVDWFLTHKRVTAPETIRLRSTDLAGASAYWIDVRAFDNPAEMIRVAAQVLQPGVIRIDSTNVAALSLDLPSSLRGPSDQLQIVWNGQAHELQAKDGKAELGSIPTDSKLHKRAGLEGPLPAVIATPFAVVVGTTSKDARMREFIQSAADSLAQRWLEWQKQPLRVFKDTELTAAQEKDYSLILLGGADANAVTRRFSKQLPFSTSRGAIIVDGRQWKNPDAVLQAIYPSPTAADRYLYVVAASSPDGMYFGSRSS